MSQFDVALVGEFNLDVVLYGLPESLPPEHELLASDMALLLGGSTAITANNLARLGNRVGLIAPKAEDMFAGYCVAELEDARVDLSRTVAAPHGIRTGVSVHLQHENFRRSLTYTGSTACLRFDDLDLAYLCSARHFHLASLYLQQGLIDDVPRLLALLKEAGLSTSLDTNDDPTGAFAGTISETLKYVDIFMPNEREAMALSGEASFERAVARLSSLVPVVVIKRGERGALVVDRGRRIEQPAVSVQPVDAVGAGDSFNAGFLHGYLQGWVTEECLRMGNLAGAYSTTQIGGTSAFRDQRAMGAFFQGNAPDLYRVA
ncbi:carbohydrate kinase family protein [Acidicapsa acidisoli]|uniref:carbohydrate kinase family protein n=1 Tax=Acidicapsa acidisoli TaxID=1615681 RepID=UPI0021E03502|nr:sugar kinase [Acidicapsa acidisoli]